MAETAAAASATTQPVLGVFIDGKPLFPPKDDKTTSSSSSSSTSSSASSDRSRGGKSEDVSDEMEMESDVPEPDEIYVRVMTHPTIQQQGKDILQERKTAPKDGESLIYSDHQVIEKDQPAIYLGQGEYGIVFFDDARASGIKYIGSDEATTCIILVLESTGEDEGFGWVCVSHIDGQQDDESFDGMLYDIAKRIELRQKIKADSTPGYTVPDQTIVNVKVHIAGGFSDSDSSSEENAMKIFDFLQNFHEFEGTPKCCDHDHDHDHDHEKCDDEHCGHDHGHGHGSDEEEEDGEEEEEDNEEMEHDHHHHEGHGCCGGGDGHEHSHEPTAPSKIKFRFHITSCCICTYNSRPEVVKVFSSSGKSSSRTSKQTWVKKTVEAPRVRGLAYNFDTNKITPAMFKERGPTAALRLSLCCYGEERIHFRGLLPDPLASPKPTPVLFCIQPQRWNSKLALNSYRNRLKASLALDDFTLLKTASTSPYVEGPDFIPSIRSSYEYILKNQPPASDPKGAIPVFGNPPQPLWYSFDQSVHEWRSYDINQQ